MQYFTQDYLEYFKELAPNNNKEWFDTNRKRYENVVREPFKIFISELIRELAKRDSEIQIEAKDAIFRINRDIRFSKDKTPYKLNNSAIISKEGRKNKNYPGIYIELSPEKFSFYGGIFMPDTKQIHKIRTYIAQNLKEFSILLNDKVFENNFGEMHGDKNKRIPVEFRELGENQPLLFNKQWYYFTNLSPEIILKDSLMQTILDLYVAAEEMKNFLTNALYKN
jgi:uncharacterized protein (TIGR02453 family)